MFRDLANSVENWVKMLTTRDLGKVVAGKSSVQVLSVLHSRPVLSTKKLFEKFSIKLLPTA